MTGFDVYRIYMALKLHFSQEKYDVFVNGGAVRNLTQESFDRKPIRHRFNQMGSRFANSQQAAEFLVGCFLYDADIFDQDSCDEASKRWIREKEMSTRLILDEMEDLLDISNSLEGDPCHLQKLLSAKRISISTAVALNRVFNYAPKWKNNFVYGELGLKIMKADKFVKYNYQKVTSYIKDHANTQAA